jgi:hypothetical protein
MLTVTNHTIQNAFNLNHCNWAQEKNKVQSPFFQNNTKYFYAFCNTMEHLDCQQYKLNWDLMKKLDESCLNQSTKMHTLH